MLAFIPHGHCYLWQTNLVRLHVISDSLIALAYATIPLILVYLVKKREDIPFDWLFVMFGAFILSCGTSHIMGVWTLWHPDYWLSGTIKAFTALVSVMTAIALIPLIPKILAIPSPAQLEAANHQLEKEVRQRSLAEESLQKEREFLKALLENLSDGIVACNEQGILTLFNRATREFHGLPAQPLPAERWADCFDLYQADGKTVMQTDEIPLFRALQGETVRDAEMVIAPKKGKVRTLLASGQTIYDSRGEKVGAVVAMHDISDRKRAEEALKQANQKLETRVEARTRELRESQGRLIQNEKMSALGQLVAGVAHEINNPVNFIYGNLTPVENYVKDLLTALEIHRQHHTDLDPDAIEQLEELDVDFLQEDLPKVVNSMKEGARRIREIVLSLRTFSRLDEAEYKDTNIHEGIDSTLTILQHRLRAKPESLAIQVIKNYDHLPRIDCYAGQLNQVFMNILSNAIDAIEERNKKRTPEAQKENFGTIAITTKLDRVNDRVSIKIRDNGMGIPEDLKNRIFDPFFTTKAIGKGTGLGMSISYQIIVEKHGGHLDYTSSPGEGTEFAIALPLSQNT
ncbi:MAG: ATP-binding protein [Cyanobacteria bacterium P01_E01_bin.42]